MKGRKNYFEVKGKNGKIYKYARYTHKDENGNRRQLLARVKTENGVEKAIVSLRHTLELNHYALKVHRLRRD